jgi:hypothetical protein
MLLFYFLRNYFFTVSNLCIEGVCFVRQVLREGQGQAALATSSVALDTVITNALIVDAVTGIIKADIGIKVDGLFVRHALLVLANFTFWHL